MVVASSTPASSGICSSHHPITRPLLEKKRAPPISIRLPLYRTVREIPPISRDASSTIGLISECFRNSKAAVNPAGPAPIIRAVLLFELFDCISVGRWYGTARLSHRDRASGVNDFQISDLTNI